MESTLYPIYRVAYETCWNSYKEAMIATDSEEKIPIIVEKHARKNPRINERLRKAKDIGFRVLESIDTGFKADKEGIIANL